MNVRRFGPRRRTRAGARGDGEPGEMNGVGAERVTRTRTKVTSEHCGSLRAKGDVWFAASVSDRVHEALRRFCENDLEA